MLWRCHYLLSAWYVFHQTSNLTQYTLHIMWSGIYGTSHKKANVLRPSYWYGYRNVMASAHVLIQYVSRFWNRCRSHWDKCTHVNVDETWFTPSHMYQSSLPCQTIMNLPFFRAACPCAPSGGLCDGYGGCYCYPGYTGQYCDEMGRENARRHEGGWDAHVGTVWL